MPALSRMSVARVAVAASVIATGLMVAATTGSAVAWPAIATASPAPGPVSTTPVSGTPRLATTSTTTEQIRQLVPCGSMMYAVGTFSQIRWNSASYNRGGAFSFQADAPYKVSSFDPEVNGVVNTIAFNGNDCANAYIGGIFTSVNGTAVKNIAEVNTTTGAVVPTFRHSSASAQVSTIVASNGHLLTGGFFTSLNGSAADPYFTSLNPATGANDHYLALDISGNYSFTDQDGFTALDNPTEIYNQQLSPDGTRDLIEGDFTTVGGQARQQVAMIDLGTPTATLDAWFPPAFKTNCDYKLPFYAQGGAWSPDGSTVYIASTGYRPADDPGHNVNGPRAGLCDSASAFPTTSGPVIASWINYTGCDSLYATAADASTAYFTGHERWSTNSHGCDVMGSGAIVAPGLEGLSPTDGSLTVNPTRARGLGADDLVLTAAGLWIASDNFQGSDQCGGVAGHAGICLLRYVNATAVTPTIAGASQVGHTVTCVEPQPSGVSTTYSWSLAGTPVSRAVSYAIPATAYNKSLSCQATAQIGTGPTSTATSASTVVTLGAALGTTVRPALVHAPRIRRHDTARHGTWSPRATSYSYQWYVDGQRIKAATTATYVVPPRDLKRRLTVTVTAHAAGYANGVATTASAKVTK
jgi:hypothetical protein